MKAAYHSSSTRMSSMTMQTSDDERTDVRVQSLMISVALERSSAVGRVSMAAAARFLEISM